jgi:hypothetical protein
MNVEKLIEIAKKTKGDTEDSLEVLWLESDNEWCVCRGCFVIEDNLEEQEAYNLLDILQAECDE